MTSQAPHSLIMIRPNSFGFNPETAASNVFQQELPDVSVPGAARKEFETTFKKLKKAGVEIHLFEETADSHTPDAIFPNNWFMTIPDGRIVLCPMESSIRRKERRTDIVDYLKKKFQADEVIDLHKYEDENLFLEGTGSIVFDHIHKKAYACPSSRTNEKLLNKLCQQIGYTPVIFISRDDNGGPIYHTNVLLSIGSGYALLCLDAVHPADHEIVLQSLADDKIKVISISYKQMKEMACNALEVQTKGLENVLVMSESAMKSLLPGQIDGVTRMIDILTVSIPTIERVGGGGIRCMLAGIHLPQKR